jgi:hypothetical protein
MSAPRLAYSMADAVEATGLSRSHLDRAIRDGQLRSRTTKLDKKQRAVGKRVILARDLEAYLESLEEA